MKCILSIILSFTLLLFTSCSSTENARKESTVKPTFPIRVISGEVNLHIIVYSYNDNSIGVVPYMLANEDAKTKIRQSNSETKMNNSYKEIENKTELKKEGDIFYYDFKKNHKVVITITSNTDSSFIECSNKIYPLKKGDKGVYFTFNK